MVAINREYLIDLACIQDMTVLEIASRIGTSVSYVEKFCNRNRSLLTAARAETAVSDAIHSEVLALWGDNYPREYIATKTSLSYDVVRRLILAAEYDEQPEELGASLELMALRLEHPDRMYVDDVRAVHETRMWLSAPDAGLRSAA